MTDDDDANERLELDIRALACTAQALAQDAIGPEQAAYQSRAITTLLCAAMGLARQCGVEPETIEAHLHALAPAVYVIPSEALN